MEMGCPSCGGQGRPTSLTLPVPEVGPVILVRCQSCMTEYWRKDGTTRGKQSEYWEGYNFDSIVTLRCAGVMKNGTIDFSDC